VYDYPSLERGDIMTTNLKQSLLALPGIGVALVPKLFCPLCWPLYAGIVFSIGLGFLIGTAYLLPITSAFLVLTLAVLGFRANQRRGYRPLLAGSVGSAAVLVGKFYLESNPITYGGVGFLVVASVWNAWPRREKTAVCPSCAPDSTVEIEGMNQGRL
jgi:mercuric ion transport protein